MSTDREQDRVYDRYETGVEAIDEFAGRAALDSSGRWYNLLGKDTDGNAHYLKDRGGYGEIAIINPDQEVEDAERIEYRNGLNQRRMASYVWEKEWEVLTRYGATGVEDHDDGGSR